METYRSGHNGADSKSVREQSPASSNLAVSAITDTPFDTIVSRGVSLFNREKRSDYKGFVVTALHFMVSVAKIKWFLQGRIIPGHKILWKYIVKQPNFVKQPIAEKLPRVESTPSCVIML